MNKEEQKDEKVAHFQEGDLPEEKWKEQVQSHGKQLILNNLGAWADARDQKALFTKWVEIHKNKGLQPINDEQESLLLLETIWVDYSLKGSVKQRQKGMKWLHSKHMDSLETYFRQKAPEAEREDMASQTMILFIENVIDGKYTGQVNVHSYLHGIARNLVRRYFRKKDIQQRHEEFIVPENHAPSPETWYVSEETKASVAQIVKMLDDKCQRILRMWMQKYSMKEIAELLDFKNETVARNIKRRCFKRLLNILEKNPQLTQRLKEWQ